MVVRYSRLLFVITPNLPRDIQGAVALKSSVHWFPITEQSYASSGYVMLFLWPGRLVTLPAALDRNRG